MSKLIDISGNQNHGTIVGAISTKDGLKFDAGRYVSLPSNSLTNGFSLSFRLNFTNFGTSQYLFGESDITQGYCIISATGKFVIRFANNGNYLAFSNVALPINDVYNITIVYDKTGYTNIYINGVLNESKVCLTTSILDVRTLGYHTKNPLLSGISDFRVYNRTLTAQEAKAYHNSFVKTYINETMENHPVGDTNPKGWIAGTGAYKISESVDKGKYLECTTAGTIAIPSKQSYGEWEFSVQKGADGNYITIPFISDRANATLDGANGYNFRVNSNEQVVLDLNNDGSHTAKIVTATSYIANNTDYRIKVARLKSEGVFKDIPTLQVSNMVNRSSLGYTTFTSNGRYGFSASATASGGHFAGTADELPIVNTAKYLVEFDLKLNSGTAPSIRIMEQLASGTISNTVVTTNGRNSIILTATSTTTGVLEFFNTTATDYEVSGLQIRRIYDKDSFAVFIKGGAYGNTETGWTLVDTTGGSGTNPVVDSTYTTSEYFVADLDVGDRIANLKINSGVMQ